MTVGVQVKSTSSWASSLNMQFDKPDHWALDGPTRSITSYLSLSFDDSGLWGGVTAGPISTGQHGLGWTFIVQAVAPPYQYRNTPSMCIRISIATHTVTTSDIGRLQIDITPQPGSRLGDNLTLVGKHETGIRLPAEETFPLATYVYCASASEPPSPAGGTTFNAAKYVFKICVEIPPSFTLDPNDGYQRNLRSVLTNSLNGGGELGDTKFCLFTHRGGYDSDVTGLDAVYANSMLLRGHSARLDDLLKEEKVTPEDLLKQPHYVQYDYDSDSDLEDADTNDHHDLEDANDLLVWDLGSDVTSSEEGNETQSKSPSPILKDGQSAILIQGFSFQTWKTFVHYLHTGSGEIHFKALRSAQLRAPAPSQAREDDSHPPSCSPKSMYRLATEFECEKLKTSSLTAIIQNLSKDNILDELFSYFTSQYTEVRNAEMEALIPFLKEPTFVEALLGKMHKTVINNDGRKPHCATVITALTARIIELANKEPEVRPCEDCASRAAEEEKLRIEAEEKKRQEAEEEEKKKARKVKW